jgi:signal transduction histidine kinase
VRPLADEHGTKLTFEKPGDELTVVTDPRRVRQILLNLLSNAIKFGMQKPIRVTCARRDEGGIRISVIDQGEGISQDDQARIFEEFVQVSPTQQMGTGLGLPISRRLADLLDGSLDVISRPGTGSTFVLNLPAEGTPRSYLEDDFAASNKDDAKNESKPPVEGSNSGKNAPAHGVRVA